MDINHNRSYNIGNGNNHLSNHNILHKSSSTLHLQQQDDQDTEIDDDQHAFYSMIKERSQNRTGSIASEHKNYNSFSTSSKLFVQNSSIMKLPPELLLLIFSFLNKRSDLINVALVCKLWADMVIDLIWFRPGIQNVATASEISEVLKMPRDQTYWDYRPFIRRLNLSFIGANATDEFIQQFVGCVNLERITLVNCSKLTHSSIYKLLFGCKRLQSLDLTGVRDITDDIYITLAHNCPRLQGVYAPNSQKITKAAVLELVRCCPMLKRIKFSECSEIDDDTLIELAEHCPNVVELDLHGCNKITDASLKILFAKLEQLREFKISHNNNITDECFDLLPNEPCLDKLRIIDFTSCNLIGDKAVEKFVVKAPRLRNVVLSKCVNITDASLRSLSLLGKCLHYIHLGHCSNITDFGTATLIRNCHRLQYVDFACCSQLTNETLRELSTLPRLRRIGLVKCNNITDEGINALANSRRTFEDTLERVHLSYCIQITLRPIYNLLMACPKLTHLSLTGITAFLRNDITKFCRSPPVEFSDHQRSLFCVFSGRGVENLRCYLISIFDDRGGSLATAILDGQHNAVQRLLMNRPINEADSRSARLMLAARNDGEFRAQLDGSGARPIAFIREPIAGQNMENGRIPAEAIDLFNRLNYFRNLVPQAGQAPHQQNQTSGFPLQTIQQQRQQQDQQQGLAREQQQQQQQQRQLNEADNQQMDQDQDQDDYDEEMDED
ncbi:hypothetical protein PACTADRAFT_68606 [Pachysolen tannophilus NRRL Y-2460]|uniref:F-box domain-containing protein n=1 Tax=Pachysolen tannophilus NRRL Y-2460 TaxID=669874 RepID=A0A1E4TUD9_PACTA|nr:hypothetical protein PACTADRAFT_68606 [Pachysolen tannophilus NRRL Y-2460]